MTLVSLLLDTSTEKGGVAFLRERELLFQDKSLVGFAHSRHLFSAIAAGCEKLSCPLSALSYIGVGQGPGSYTGMRIAAVVAKAVNYSSQVPLVPFPSLIAFVPPVDGPFVSLVDAKVSGVYLMKGKKEGDHIDWLTSPAVCSLDQLEEECQEFPVFVSPNPERLQQRLAEQKSCSSKKWYEEEFNPIVVERYVQERYLRGETTDWGQLELLYLRKTQAEIERDVAMGK